MGSNSRLPRNGGRTLSVAGAVGIAVAAIGLSAGAAHGTPRLAAGGHAVGSAGRASSARFDSPSGVAVGDGHVWVSNRNGNSVTEINPSTGAVVRTLTASAYKFNQPNGVASSGGDIFVANGAGWVTKINASTGKLLHVITGKAYGFSHPVAIKADGGTVLVVDQPGTGAGALTEFSAGSDAWLHRITGASIKEPAAVTPAGGEAFIADEGTNAVTEVNVGSGKIVRAILDQGIDVPDGIANGDGHVWVADSATSSITEIAAATGKVLGNFNNSDSPNYGFNDVGAAYDSGNTLYVATPHGSSPMVTHVSAVNGSPAWFMCNTNGPYYFSDLTGFAMDGADLWVTSSDSDNYPNGNGAGSGGSITEMNGTSGALIRTVSYAGVVSNP